MKIMTLKNKLIERDHMITQLIKSKNENQEKATQEATVRLAQAKGNANKLAGIFGM